MSGLVTSTMAGLVLVGLTAGLLLSRSTADAAVPTVSEEPTAAAASLKELGFVVSNIIVPNDTVPTGQVIKTEPAAGRKIKKGSTVTVYVSGGPPQVVVPAVSGTADAATTALKRAGFTVRRIAEPSTRVASGSVTRTIPAGGIRASRGSSVTIYVSSGPAVVTVPDVTNKPEWAADAILRSAGFLVRHRYDYSTTIPRGLVISTKPSAEAKTRQGATVQEYTSLGPQYVPPSGPAPSSSPAPPPPPSPSPSPTAIPTTPIPTTSSPGGP
jgi:beta-lactam-binding protein with PASTA domain